MPETNNLLPDFICAGMEKCGTTSFYDLLAQHPRIGLSSNKETHFFSSQWGQGLDWYKGKFAHVDKNCLCTGEITPAYHRFPECIERIRQTLGDDTRIIFLLRDPLLRAFSHYVHDIANTQTVKNSFVFKSYLKTTPYTQPVRDYINAFGQDNVLTLVFEEDFLPDPQVAMDKVFGFLGVNSIAITRQHSNPTWYPVIIEAPASHDSLLEVEGREIIVPAASLLYWTGRAKNTRVFTPEQRDEAENIRKQLESAKQHIPLENLHQVFDQTAKADILDLQQLIHRDLSCWGQYNKDLDARYPPDPHFRAIEG